MDEQLAKEIKNTIVAAITKFFTGRKVTVSHVLDKLFPVDRKIRSLIGGLETSMGTTIWEPIAKALAKYNNFELVESELLKPDHYPSSLESLLNRCRELRSTKELWIPMKECVKMLKEEAINCDRDDLRYIKPPAGKGVDLYLKKYRKEYAFDIKTNQINQAGGQNLNWQLLEWYAYRICGDPDADFEARIAFPFNPFPKDWWEVMGSRAYPLQKGEDAWVQDEFWDFLSGQQNTWDQILNIFDELGSEGFGSLFKDIFRV